MKRLQSEPPAWGGKLSTQLPEARVAEEAWKVALVCRFFSVPKTGELGVAEPHMDTAALRCSTMPLPKREARRKGSAEEECCSRSRQRQRRT
jgi:hypothetical protein